MLYAVFALDTSSLADKLSCSIKCDMILGWGFFGGGVGSCFTFIFRAIQRYMCSVAIEKQECYSRCNLRMLQLSAAAPVLRPAMKMAGKALEFSYH